MATIAEFLAPAAIAAAALGQPQIAAPLAVGAVTIPAIEAGYDLAEELGPGLFRLGKNTVNTLTGLDKATVRKFLRSLATKKGALKAAKGGGQLVSKEFKKLKDPKRAAKARKRVRDVRTIQSTQDNIKQAQKQFGNKPASKPSLDSGAQSSTADLLGSEPVVLDLSGLDISKRPLEITEAEKRAILGRIDLNFLSPDALTRLDIHDIVDDLEGEL